MSVQLQDVDYSNWRECVELKVSEEEAAFIDPNSFTIAEWKFEPENKVKAIYSDSELVGMLAYYYHEGAYGEFYWLYHLMIEPTQQSKGYGQEAVKLSIMEMRSLGAKEIVTNCMPENIRAQYIYKKLGFKDYSTLDGGDLFLCLPERSKSLSNVTTTDKYYKKEIGKSFCTKSNLYIRRLDDRAHLFRLTEFTLVSRSSQPKPGETIEDYMNTFSSKKWKIPIPKKTKFTIKRVYLQSTHSVHDYYIMASLNGELLEDKWVDVRTMYGTWSHELKQEHVEYCK